MSYASLPPLAIHGQRLLGKSVLVVGASSGIGAAAARLFSREGARVTAAARRGDRLSALAAGLAEEGLAISAVLCDVTEEASVASMVATTIELHGGLDAAFNCAGATMATANIERTDTAGFDRVDRVNLRGTFLCLKYQVAAMLTGGGGAIVNTASAAAVRGGAGHAAYAASKAGIVALTRSAALDHAARGIRVNAIAPGPTRSEMFDHWIEGEAARAQVALRFPMNYVAHPDDMARVALFLLSDEARWTTGALIPCDGGASAL